MTKIKKE